MRMFVLLLILNLFCLTDLLGKQNKNINKKVAELCFKFPAGWGQNANKKWLPGSIAHITVDGKKLLELSGTIKGPVHCFQYKRIKANDGDKIEFTVKTKGKGIGGVGLYQYPEDGSWKWNGAVYKSFKVAAELKVTVKGKQPTGNVCLVVWAGKNSEIIIHAVKAKKL